MCKLFTLPFSHSLLSVGEPAGHIAVGIDHDHVDSGRLKTLLNCSLYHFSHSLLLVGEPVGHIAVGVEHDHADSGRLKTLLNV